MRTKEEIENKLEELKIQYKEYGNEGMGEEEDKAQAYIEILEWVNGKDLITDYH